jgi:hypothetical protein
VEAVSKQVGGLYYTYAIRGDGQTVTQPVSKQQQLNALNAIVDCIDPKVLSIPERITKLIPPRPAGYSYNRELFSKRTGLAFDPLAAAETAADYPLSFLFNTARLNRMVQYQAENNGLGVNEMLNMFIEKVWKAKPLLGMEELIRQQNAQLLLSYILVTSMNDNASFPVKAAITKAIADIKALSEMELKITKNTTEKGYLLLTLERIKSPEKAQTINHIAIAPGSPIGCGMD